MQCYLFMDTNLYRILRKFVTDNSVFFLRSGTYLISLITIEGA